VTWGRGVAAGSGGCSFVQKLDFISTLTTFFAISYYIPLIPVLVLKHNALSVVALSCLITTLMWTLQPYEVRFKIQRKL
jgi:hypothetical protein